VALLFRYLNSNLVNDVISRFFNWLFYKVVKFRAIDRDIFGIPFYPKGKKMYSWDYLAVSVHMCVVVSPALLTQFYWNCWWCCETWEQINTAHFNCLVPVIPTRSEAYLYDFELFFLLKWRTLLDAPERRKFCSGSRCMDCIVGRWQPSEIVFCGSSWIGPN
jgi:hypothetical protein